MGPPSAADDRLQSQDPDALVDDASTRTVDVLEVRADVEPGTGRLRRHLSADHRLGRRPERQRPGILDVFRAGIEASPAVAGRYAIWACRFPPVPRAARSAPCCRQLGIDS